MELSPERLQELNRLEQDLLTFRERVALIGNRASEIRLMLIGIARERLGGALMNIRGARARMKELEKIS